MQIRVVLCNLSSGARTLSPDDLGKNSSGWTITGEVTRDYFEWINSFEAEHPTLGWVRGNYENTIEASSEEAYAHFVTNHPPREWDYGDI